MFAALCDNGDFFKNKMKIAYMYAPITRIQNMEASMF